MRSTGFRLLVVAVVGYLCVPAAASEAISTRVITDGEKAMLTTQLAPDKQELVAAQSFQVQLPLVGSRYFVSLKTGRDDPPLVEFHIVNEQGVSLQTLEPAESWAMLWEVEAVSFRDMNADGIRDITVIVSWMTGVGPTGAQAFNAATIFLCDPATGRFAADTALLKNAPYESTSTLGGIIEFLANKP